MDFAHSLYYAVINNGLVSPPFPIPEGGTNLPAYTISDGVYVIDSTATFTGTVNPVTLSNALTLLIEQTQANIFFALDSPPLPGGGGGTNYGTNYGGGSSGVPTYSITTNYSQYTNFWLTISNISTNLSQAQVTVVSTLPGLYYAILTNVDLSTTNWSVWTTLLASNSFTPAPPIALSTNHLFFRGKIVLPGGSYITNGLVAYWKMNDASGTNAADSRGNGVTMPLVGSPYWGPGCLILNGINQYGDAGSNALTSLDQHDKTICAWIYKTNSGFSGIVDKSLATGTAGWGFWDTGTSLAFYVSNGDGYFPDSVSDAVQLNQWVFTAVTWHGPENVAFYTNGVLNCQIVRTGIEQPSGAAHLQLGNLQVDNSSPMFWFGGYMRDVAVYDRVLSPSEVVVNFFNSQYQISNGVAYPDLLYYKMGDYNTNNATNKSFTLYDSSIHGGTTGAYHNSSETWVTNGAGLTNTALHFGGNLSGAYLDTSNSTLFNFTTNLFTINFWVNPFGVRSGENLIQNETPLTNGWSISLNGNNTISFETETNGPHAVTTDDLIVDDSLTYTMVTVVRSSLTNVSIYLNGTLSKSGPIAIPAPSTNSLQIGLDRLAQYTYDGNMWLMQIWSTPLSDSDVAHLYLRQLSGSPWP